MRRGGRWPMVPGDEDGRATAMDEAPAADDEEAGDERRQLLAGFGRGFGGALIFSLPMLMTMEMWWLGFSIDRARLVLLLLLNVPLLTFLSHYSGFEQTFEWWEDLRDAMIAYAIGILTGCVVLGVFGVLAPGMPLEELVGKVAIQAIPASIGALLGRSQLGGGSKPAHSATEATYRSELFLMAGGAVFLGLNVAPTEEMILISYQMNPWQGIGLMALSMAIMHGFVYAVSFKGGSERGPDTPWWSVFLRFTVVGYALAGLISAYLLWTFGRMDGLGPGQVVMAMAVLGFPASVGAAAARLIL